MGIHADPETFPVQAHTHRNALVFLASGLFWIRWDPVGSYGGPVGFMWHLTDPPHFPVPSHMHRNALGFLASAPMGIHRGPVATHADP